MNVAISQSNYIPWAGYFGLIAKSDVFVFLDEAQFTSRDWRSRNKIKTANGLTWLTIPVGNSQSRPIFDVKLPNDTWKNHHKSTILRAFKGAHNFRQGAELIESIYGESQIGTLSEFNQYWIKFISTEILKLKCKFLDSREITHQGTGSDRILSICKSLSATNYLSGPAAATYLKLGDFFSNKIQISFADYSEMRSYAQLHGDFVPNVSILDMIFNIKTDYSEFIEIATFQP
jgi:hypothetical protein